MFLQNQPPSIEDKTVEVSHYKQLGAATLASSSSGDLAAAQWSNKGDKTEAGRWSEEQLRIMAEYTADMYAKTPEERAHYVEYYKGFYRDGGDTSAAEVALTQSVSEKKTEKKNDMDLGMVVVNGVEYKKYPPPDTSTYQYDETRGYHYDPVSTLHYDKNIKCYYNPETSRLHYWDAQHETFLPVVLVAGIAQEDISDMNTRGAMQIVQEVSSLQDHINNGGTIEIVQGEEVLNQWCKYFGKSCDGQCSYFRTYANIIDHFRRFHPNDNDVIDITAARSDH